MMQTLHAMYAGQDAATQAVERVVALGIPREAIQIVGAPERPHMGSFADSGPHAHTAERDHVGSFADVDRGPSAPARIVGELVATGLTPDAAAEARRRLAAGSVLVLVRVPEEQARIVRDVFGQEP